MHVGGCPSPPLPLDMHKAKLRYQNLGGCAGTRVNSWMGIPHCGAQEVALHVDGFRIEIGDLEVCCERCCGEETACIWRWGQDAFSGVEWQRSHGRATAAGNGP
jgi:hypothetical protein